MLILAVDTTTHAGSVALLENDRLLSEVNIDSSVTHSERLLPSVDFLLRRNKIEISAIQGFAVAVGPGSFTGIRVGLSTVKSFSYASKIPVAPVSTLEALAWKLKSPQNRLLCPLIDARKNEIYAALYQVRKGRLEEAVPHGVFKPDLLFSLLPSHRIIHFIGDGVDAYRKKIDLYFKDKARISSRSNFIAAEVGRLGYRILKAGKGLDAHHVEPLYIRRSQAEEGH